jgi:hypothetical protein
MTRAAAAKELAKVDYLKLYVGFRDDPKVVGLSDDAFRAHVVALCWVAQHETDGYVALDPGPSALGELERAGLWDRRGPHLYIHNWGKYQRSHAELDAKRTAARNAARTRWSNAERTPNVHAERNAEVEVEVEVEEAVQDLDSKAASRTVNNDQIYLAEHIEQANGETLSPAALQKLDSEYGTEAVTSALRRLHGFPPPEPIGSVYAYVESLCQTGVDVG